jgi:hypothetical protein
MLTDRPNIVYCDHRPRRAKKCRPQPEPACGRIITIPPTKKREHYLAGCQPSDRRSTAGTDTGDAWRVSRRAGPCRAARFDTEAVRLACCRHSVTKLKPPGIPPETRFALCSRCPYSWPISRRPTLLALNLLRRSSMNVGMSCVDFRSRPRLRQVFGSTLPLAQRSAAKMEAVDLLSKLALTCAGRARVDALHPPLSCCPRASRSRLCECFLYKRYRHKRYRRGA